MRIIVDPVFGIFDPFAYLSGGVLFILVGLAIAVVLFKDRLKFIIQVQLLKRYPITCYVFELRANIPVPVSRLGAIKLAQEDGNYDVLRLQTGEKVRVFGYSDMYSYLGKPVMFLLRVGAYEFHVMGIDLTENISIPAYDKDGKVIVDEIKSEQVGADGQPILDNNGNPVMVVKQVPRMKEIQTVMFRPRIDEDVMAWVVREMRRSEQRRRDKSMWGTVFPLVAPLLLAIGLMLLLKGTLDPLVQVATTLGPDMRAVASALQNVQIIAAGPRPPV